MFKQTSNLSLILTRSTRKSFNLWIILIPIEVWTRAQTRLNDYLISHSIVNRSSNLTVSHLIHKDILQTQGHPDTYSGSNPILFPIERQSYSIFHQVNKVKTWLILTWSTRESFDLRVILIPIQVRARPWTWLNDSTRKRNFRIFSQNISGSSVLLTLGPVALGVDDSDWKRKTILSFIYGIKSLLSDMFVFRETSRSYWF